MTPVVVVGGGVFFFGFFVAFLFSRARVCFCAAQQHRVGRPSFSGFFLPQAAKGLRIQKGAKFFSREVKFLAEIKRKALSYKNDSKNTSRVIKAHTPT